MSRFAPTDTEALAQLRVANERAEKLARRIGAAVRALKSGQSSTVVLALLGGAEDEQATT